MQVQLVSHGSQSQSKARAPSLTMEERQTRLPMTDRNTHQGRGSPSVSISRLMSLILTTSW
jgi:hypothetical protein